MMNLLVAAVFLPLFPFSILLNAVLARVKHPAARFVVLLSWPQIGVLALHAAAQPLPAGFVAWSLLSSALYALRLLTVRDLGLWAGYLACSSFALLWAGDHGLAPATSIFAFWFSLPLALLLLLEGALAKRFGAAYAGLYGGLAASAPRLSGLLVFTLLAAIATPPFPGFFAMLGLLHGVSTAPVVLLIWLLWGWAAIKLMQGFLSGVHGDAPVTDIGKSGAVLATCFLGGIVFVGIYLAGGVL